MIAVPEAVIDLIRGGGRFLVTCHRRPDVDAMGSALGLAAVLRSLGKQALVYAPDGKWSRSVEFVAQGAQVSQRLPEGTSFDATFVLDTAAPELLPRPWPDRAISGPVVVIDHHAVFEPYGDLVFRDPDACASGELVLRIGEVLAAAPPEAAAPLYAALVADTGGFRYPRTTASILRRAAALLDQGVDPWQVASNVFENWSMARLELLRTTLGTLELRLEGRLATLWVSREMIKRASGSADLVDGFVNYGRQLEGVEVAALALELSPDPNTKLSLRSNGTIDVARVSAILGGGGHPGAAGAAVALSVHDALDRVTEEVRTCLGSAPQFK